MTAQKCLGDSPKSFDRPKVPTLAPPQDDIFDFCHFTHIFTVVPCKFQVGVKKFISNPWCPKHLWQCQLI
jgi:hypothetical protein